MVRVILRLHLAQCALHRSAMCSQPVSETTSHEEFGRTRSEISLSGAAPAASTPSAYAATPSSADAATRQVRGVRHSTRDPEGAHRLAALQRHGEQLERPYGSVPRSHSIPALLAPTPATIYVKRTAL